MVHRIGNRDEGYLLPHDADPEDLVTRGLLMADLARWIEAVEAKAVVLCLDCCHAAKVLPRGNSAGQAVRRDMRIRPTILQELTGRGRYLIASCDDGEVSLEADDWGHGLFTYHLLEGIRGAGDRDLDGRVGVAELFEHVAESVEREARAMGVTQKPWNCSIGAGGVYLSTPQRTRQDGTSGPSRASPVVAAERLWREKGAEAAVGSLEQTTDWADVGRLLSILDLLRAIEHPAVIPIVFRCLAHACDEVRARAKKVVQGFGWERVTSFVEAISAQGDGEKISPILDGLAAFESHGEILKLLDRLVTLLKSDMRNRAILLLERKQQSLDLERIAELFRDSSSAYRIQKALGQGLSTAAYLARDESNEFDVVVRVLRAELANFPQVRAQFLDLSRRSMKLVHHNLVLTREVRAFPERNIYYVVRDYVDGITLQKLLESGREFSPDQIMRIVRQLLHALTPVHSIGTVHGSIKPSNIFLCGEDRVVLGDLALPLRGVSLQLDRLSYDFRYAPPEMFRQGGTLGPWSDFYSLGCVAYELACGAPPFVSDNYFELAGLHDREPVELPSKRGSRLGPEGDALLLRSLAKAPSDRVIGPGSALQTLDDLYQELRSKSKPAARPTPILGDESLIRYTTDAMMSVVSFPSGSRGARPEQVNPAKASVGEPSSSPGDGMSSAQTPIEVVSDASDLSRTAPMCADELEIPPQRLGNYLIIRLIGSGGMGAVYLARDEALARNVAIKLIRRGFLSSGFSLESLIVREAKAAAQLRHPNIVTIHNVGETDGRVFIVLEYINGRSLDHELRESGPLGTDEAAQLAANLASAMHHAHKSGIVHRDLKPSNILIDQDRTPKITDFGLAKLMLDRDIPDEDASLTEAGQIVGTPAYMSPEQATGDTTRIGPAADIFSLGAILYEMLAGQAPFRGASVAQTLANLIERTPTPLRDIRPGVPRQLEAICLKCLEKQPEHRYASAAALAEDLDRFLAGEPIEARSRGLWERILHRFSSRKPGRVKNLHTGEGSP
jgi:serine/threonine protein kinase